ncbi:LysR family transcriptional regulator [Lampropedia puyangensis]|uniref:LysR family transcriptional regulator n=1 Tax=Lampropedia puyangensis TaxID=1330072 RepID=A0A4S8FEY4_9BURK|nr:LysR family transcriptional regulator [Lampropedia puyangensis]THU05194.1 LysR family transcriptional regulator [Lampropedia puyangensis]
MPIASHLKHFDLNLLLVFQCLMQECSVTRAAQSLGMSQPAVSGALARLRQATGDALFVRSGRSGMQPTPFAEQLAEPVAQALSSIAHHLRSPVAFDPKTSSRQFTVAMLDVAEVHFMPQWIAYCDTHAPNVRLAVHTPQLASNGVASVQEALRAGSVDLAIGAFEDMPQGAMQQLLFEQSFVVIARADHPHFKRAGFTNKRQGKADKHQQPGARGSLPLLQPTMLAHSRCVLVHQPQGGYAQAQRLLLSAAGASGAHHYCASQVTVPLVVAQTDAMAIVPERLAQEFATTLGLSVARLDGADLTLKTYCFWHPKFHQDQANRWLRACLLKLFGG